MLLTPLSNSAKCIVMSNFLDLYDLITMFTRHIRGNRIRFRTIQSGASIWSGSKSKSDMGVDIV